MEYLSLRDRLEFALTCKKHYNDHFIRIVRARNVSILYLFQNSFLYGRRSKCVCGYIQTICEICFESNETQTCDCCGEGICYKCYTPIGCFDDECRCDGKHNYCKKCAEKIKWNISH
jgi:hypothetical protein